MKKTKFLAFMLVIAITVMGAGYAYWTQVLDIKNTVHTGSLDVQFINDDSWGEAYESERVQNFLKSKGLSYESADYMTVTIDPNDPDVLGFQIDQIYPGAGGFLSFAIINKGTVPAKLENIDLLKLSDNLGSEDTDKFNYLVCPVTKYDAKEIAKVDINVDTDIKILNRIIREYVLDNLENIAEGVEVEYRTTYGTAKKADSVNGFLSALKTNLEGITLNPGEMVVVDDFGTFLGVDWSYLIEKDEDEEYLNTGYSIYLPTTVTAFENKVVEIDFGLNFKQQTGN